MRARGETVAAVDVAERLALVDLEILAAILHAEGNLQLAGADGVGFRCVKGRRDFLGDKLAEEERGRALRAEAGVDADRVLPVGHVAANAGGQVPRPSEVLAPDAADHLEIVFLDNFGRPEALRIDFRNGAGIARPAEREIQRRRTICVSCEVIEFEIPDRIFSVDGTGIGRLRKVSEIRRHEPVDGELTRIEASV